MASLEGFEPPTVRLEGACSIQLSYKDTRMILSELNLRGKRDMENQNERPGYRFAGWYIDEARTKRINPGGRLPHPVTLYDKWIPVIYPISYDLSGGMNSRKNPQFVSIETGAVKLYPPRKIGMRFDGWILEGEKIRTLPERIDHPITLHASWEPLYTVSFETNGGGRIADKTADEDGMLEPFTPPRKLGARFIGWYLDPELKWPFDFGTPITQDMTLYARYNTDAFEITYDVDGGINSRTNPKSYVFSEEPIELKPARRRGFRFMGWYDARGNKVDAIPARYLGPISLKAVWKKLRSHKLEE